MSHRERKLKEFFKEASEYCPTCDTWPCICKRPKTITHPSGAKRDNEQPPAYHLIPYVSLKRLAQRYSHGACKYGERNWEAGLPSDDCLDRAFEHLTRYTSGDRTEDHLAAAAWNIFAVMFYEEKEGK